MKIPESCKSQYGSKALTPKLSMVCGNAATLRLAASWRLPASQRPSLSLGSVTKTCNGEIVKFTGAEHLIATVTIDRTGGFHLPAHENIHITGTGSLGSSYEGNQENTLVLNLTAISKGSAPNFELHLLQHETVNPNGTVASFVDHSTASRRC